MRIIICSKQDLPACIALNRLLPALGRHHVKILLSNLTRPAETAQPDLAWVKFFERDLPNDTLFPLLDRLDQPVGGAMLTFAQLSRRHRAPIETIDDINSAASLAMLRDFDPDIILSMRFSLIFKQAAIDIPRHGVLNLHPGELPRYAGLFAPFRAMLAGERSVGCSLHCVDSGIDTGPIVGIRYLPISPGRSMIWHVVRTYPLGIDLVLETLDRLDAGQPIAATPQDRRLRDYRSLPNESEFARFRDAGLKLVERRDFEEFLGPFCPPPDVAAELAPLYACG